MLCCKDLRLLSVRIEALLINPDYLSMLLFRGVAWAQFQAGGKYETGEVGMGVGGRPNMRKAVQHYLLAAEQNHAPAFVHLARLHKEGVPGLIEKSSTKALEYELKAADLGNFHAMANIAVSLSQYKSCGLKADYPMAVKYATLASHYETENQTAAAAAAVLGLFFLQDGTGLESSANLAAHYLGLAVKYDESPFSPGFVEHHYSDCLRQQAENLYHFHITGFNVFPRALFWLRKSSNAGWPAAKEAIESLKSDQAGRGKCHACNATEASSGKKFLRCGRCKLYCYCSKKCQRESWNAGHKVDCKSVYD